MTKPADMIQLGFIRGAHALRGQVMVHIFSGNEEALTEYGPLMTEDGKKTFELTPTGVKGADFLCKVKNVNDRNGAEALRGTKLFVPAAALPELDEDEFYVKDLIGLTAIAPDGTLLGKIRQVANFSQHDALEIDFVHTGKIALPKPRSEYVLFTKQNVPELNLTAGTVTVDVPHGLFEDPEK